MTTARTRAQVQEPQSTPPSVFDTPEQLSQVLRVFQSRLDPIMLDTETTGLDPRKNKLVMLQLRQASGKAAVIFDCRRGLNLRPLQPLFDSHLVVMHNGKFDSQFLLMRGIKLPRIYDTMLAEQLLLGKGYGKGEGLHLKDTLERRLGIHMDKLQREWFYKPAPLDDESRQDEWNAPFPAEELEYAAKDVDALVPLFVVQSGLLTKEKLNRVARIEMRALPAIALMELRGIRVNVAGWREFIVEKAVEVKAREAEAIGTFGPPILDTRIRRYDAALEEWKQARDALKAYEAGLRTMWENGEKHLGWGDYKQEFMSAYRAKHTIPGKPKCDTSLPNIGSTHQLIDAMEGLGIPVPTKPDEKTGETKKTTDSDSLERLAPEHPLLKTVLDYRAAAKFVDAFGEKLLAFADKNDRIHPDYRQIGADTGRMSCTKPNWQQVPSKGDGARLRENVIASPGHMLISADLSNFELRALADLSSDEKMLEMFARGEDLHSYTAKLMFKLPMEWDKKRCEAEEWRGGISYRKAAKIVNYLIPYGGSAFAIAAQNNIPLSEAEELLANWGGMFSQAQDFLEGIARDVRKMEKPESRTRSGRVRRFVHPGEMPQRGFKPYDSLDRMPVGYEKMQRADLLRETDEHYGERADVKNWRKAWGAIRRAARNNPMQGLNADVIKLAAAMFYERCDMHLGIIVAIVHDELVVEAPDQQVGVVKEILADVMVEAPRTFLKQVVIPRPELKPSHTWEHD
jgi:DNA polymerase-1